MVILIILFLAGFVSTEITGNPAYYHGATFCGFSAIIIQNFYIMKRIDRDDSVISREEKMVRFRSGNLAMAAFTCLGQA